MNGVDQQEKIMRMLVEENLSLRRIKLNDEGNLLVTESGREWGESNCGEYY